MSCHLQSGLSGDSDTAMSNAFINVWPHLSLLVLLMPSILIPLEIIQPTQRGLSFHMINYQPYSTWSARPHTFLTATVWNVFQKCVWQVCAENSCLKWCQYQQLSKVKCSLLYVADICGYIHSSISEYWFNILVSPALIGWDLIDMRSRLWILFCGFVLVFSLL